MATKRELDQQYRLRIVSFWERIILAFLKYACIAVIFVTIYLSLRELKGSSTTLDIAFKAIADLKMNQYLAQLLPWGTTATSVAWALGERRLRKRHIRRTSSKISELENVVDPKRRSSKLTTEGETCPEDI